MSREYLKSAEYQQTISYIEQLTGERQKEILIPVLSRMEYRDLPCKLQVGSAVPVIGLTGKYPKAAEQNWQTIVSLISSE